MFLALLVGVWFLRKRFNLPFSARVFVAMILGMAIGLALYFTGAEETAAEVRRWFSLVGYGFVDLLRMLIIPLIPTSIVAGLLKLRNTTELKRMGSRTLGMFFLTATVASAIGIVVASVMRIGRGMSTAGLAERETQGVVDLLARFRGFIPSNPVNAAAETDLIPLVVFSLFVGVAAVIESGRDVERVKPFRDFVDSLLQVVIRMTKLVIRLTPYGVLGLMAYWMSNTGLAALADLGLFVVGVVLACAIQVGIVYGGLVTGVARVNPVRFFRAASPAMLLAFTSRSSMGTLTLTVDTMINRLKVSPRYANFVGPIGAVMNMDACGGIFPAMVSILAANAFGIELSLLQYGLIVVISILASIGSAAVPMGATAFTVVTLSTVGLPVEAIGLVAGVDFLVDMFRTATNVTGDMMTSVVVGNSLGEFDREAFASQDLSGALAEQPS
jgi:Na+/H+-dicarboxylate symporter